MAIASAATPSPGHRVSFYDHPRHLVEDVTNFSVEGLLADEAVLLVLDPRHRAEVESALAAHGVDVDAAQERGDLAVLDAEATLDRILVDGLVDRGRLDALARDVVDGLGSAGRRVRTFGEMVAVLWERGHLAGAVELEAAWNRLLRDRPIELLCAYPVGSFAGADLSAAAAICDQHSDLVTPARYPHDARGDDPVSGEVRSHTFLPAPSAVAAVRRFVGETIRGWGGGDDAADDATLIASELATNALLHARSPFRVTLHRTDGTVRLDVEDASPTPPSQLSPGVEVTTGRGIAMVHAISQRWGTDIRADGKVVWAELAIPA